MLSSISLLGTDKLPEARTDRIYWPGLDEAGVALHLRREDLLFPSLSGNKFRKLRYNIIRAQQEGHKTLLTFGGAYSNHIHATAAAGGKYGFRTIGMIRGQELATGPLNPTLRDATEHGMELHFISRESYRLREDPEYQEVLRKQYGPFYLIPEGGTNALALTGVSEILRESDRQYDFFCCAVGTGGTLAGLASAGYGEVWGYTVLKGISVFKGLSFLSGEQAWHLRPDYHFGGYGQTPPDLLDFIREFYARTGIVLDAVYTGKMLFGILQDIRTGRVPAGSQVLAIHTGGVQGNRGMNTKLKKKNIPLLPL